MGDYAGAEICEAVGLFILHKLRLKGVEANLYRDDGLLMSNKPARAIENIKKTICSVFKDIGLNITIEANLNEVNFLDVTLNIENDSYEPYCKPNNVIQYVHCKSNHPANVLKNVPIGINKRLNEISKTKELFDRHKQMYQEAIMRAGYDYTIEYVEKNEAVEKKQKITKIKTGKEM